MGGTKEEKKEQMLLGSTLYVEDVWRVTWMKRDMHR